MTAFPKYPMSLPNPLKIALIGLFIMITIWVVIPPKKIQTLGFYGRCDEVGYLAVKIMLDRQSGRSKEQAFTDMYQIVAKGVNYDGDDFRFGYGIVRNAYNWQVQPDVQPSDSAVSFGKMVAETCLTKPIGQWEVKPWIPKP